MKALIIGTGAVGCAVAIAAADGGMETAVIAKGETAGYIKKNGLKRTGIFGEIDIPAQDILVYEDYDSIEGAFDYIAVAVKTGANKEIAKNLSEHKSIMGENGKIILFQNGWGMTSLIWNISPHHRYLMPG